jgi:hypothetical protein
MESAIVCLQILFSITGNNSQWVLCSGIDAPIVCICWLETEYCLPAENLLSDCPLTNGIDNVTAAAAATATNDDTAKPSQPPPQLPQPTLANLTENLQVKNACERAKKNVCLCVCVCVCEGTIKYSYLYKQKMVFPFYSRR